MEEKIKVHQDKKWMWILVLSMMLFSFSGYQFFTSGKPFNPGVLEFMLLAFAFRM